VAFVFAPLSLRFPDQGVGFSTTNNAITRCKKELTMQTIGTQLGLLRGQSHTAHFRRGAVIAVASGSVRVISRLWLEHDTLTVQTPVPRGGVFYVPCAGLLEIAADSDAILGLAQKSGSLASIEPLRQVIVGFYRRFQPQVPLLSTSDALTIDPAL
jgi:hypothetical protein